MEISHAHSARDQPLETLARSGGIALDLHGAPAASFQYLGFKRKAIFGIDAGRESPPPEHSSAFFDK
jgi:hypothetical protein